MADVISETNVRLPLSGPRAQRKTQMWLVGAVTLLRGASTGDAKIAQLRL